MATGAIAGEQRTASIGRVFSRGFATIGDNPVTMFGIAFLFGALPTTIVSEGAKQFRGPLLFGTPGGAGGGIGVAVTLGIVSVLLYVVFVMITQGALVRATIAHSEGRRAGLGEAAGAGLRAALPLLGLSILLALGVGLGFTLFLVPGIMLYIMWSVATPALVAERSGVFAAFGRSRYLTKGARWRIFGLELVVVILYWAASAVMGAIVVAVYGVAGMVALSQQGLPVWYDLAGVAVQTVIGAVWGAIQTSLYVELRDWKDGPAADALAQIFA